MRGARFMRRAALLATAAALMWSLSLPALAAPEDDPPAGEEASAGEETPTGEETPADGETPADEEIPDLLTPDMVDPTYTGPLDSRTGLPLPEAQRERADPDAPIPLGEGSYSYDPAAGRYRIAVGTRSFTSTVPQGIILPHGESVAFHLSDGLTGVLYKNGDIVNDADLTGIRDTGEYIFQVQGGGLYDTVSFPFTIMGDLTKSLADYPLPDGFTFDSVTLNDEALTLEFNDSIDFLEEGKYVLEYSCEEIGRSYRLAFTLDRTPPSLALPEVVEGAARGPVSLADLEPGAAVQVQWEDDEPYWVTSADTMLTESGRYVLTAYDQAGNSQAYSFLIHIYLNISAFTAIALLAAGLLGIIFYCRWVRKHARVG